MSTLTTALKAEITRGAKREVNKAIAPLRKVNAAHRRDIAALKREVTQLRRELNVAEKALAKAAPSVSTEPEGSTPKRARVTTKGIRSARARLGLSADDFATLAGVSGQTIYLWEADKTTPRPAQVEALVKLRTMGKKEAAKLLEAAGAKPEVAAAGKKPAAKKAPAKKAAVKKASAKKAPTATKRATKAAKSSAGRMVSGNGDTKPSPVKKAASRRTRAQKVAPGGAASPSPAGVAVQQGADQG